MFGIHLTTDLKVAKDYGNVKTYLLSNNAKILDLTEGEDLWNFMIKEGILDKDDEDNIDLQNYVESGQVYQYDISSRTHFADDVAKTAKSLGYDLIKMIDNLGGGDNIAYVVVNSKVLQPYKANPLKIIKLIQENKMKIKNPMSTSEVGSHFWSGKAASGSSVHSSGDKLFSYGTVILQRLDDGTVIGNKTKYSVTTSKHQSQVRVSAADVFVTGIPRGTTNLRPYLEKNPSNNTLDYLKKKLHVANPVEHCQFDNSRLTTKHALISPATYRTVYQCPKCGAIYGKKTENPILADLGTAVVTGTGLGAGFKLVDAGAKWVGKNWKNWTKSKNPRKRTTEDEFVVQGHYGHGWEDVNTEETFKAGKSSLRNYRDNEPQYAHRLIHRRVKK